MNLTERKPLGTLNNPLQIYVDIQLQFPVL